MTSSEKPAAASAPAPAAAPLHPRSGLVAAIERILGRSLTTEEVLQWQKIQDVYGVSDDDPLVMVLILLGVHQHLYNDVPTKISDAVDKAITVHRTTLEDQATIVAKGLLAQLAPMFAKAMPAAQQLTNESKMSRSWRELAMLGGVAFGCSLFGVIVGHILFR